MSIRIYLGAFAISWLASGTAVGAEIAPSPHAKADAAAIAALIDRHLDADWKARGIKPAAPADDAEFARRVYLDVIGRARKSLNSATSWPAATRTSASSSSISS